MNIASDCKFAYVVNHEAWYAGAAWPADKCKPTVMVQSADAENQGCEWEFAIEEHELGDSHRPRPAIRVKMFDDAFAAWEQVPELFTALREEAPNTLNHVRAILEELGAEDITDRVGPYGGRTPEQQRAASLRAQAADLTRQAEELDPSGEVAPADVHLDEEGRAFAPNGDRLN